MKRLLGASLTVVLAFGLLAVAFAQTTGPNDVEVLGFVLPSTNTNGYRAHASSTEMHVTIPLGDIRAAGGYKMPYTFAHGDFVGTSATNSSALVAGSTWFRTTGTIAAGFGTQTGTGTTVQIAPFAGSVLGVSVAASTALTAGGAHVEATIFRFDQGTTENTGLTAMLDAAASLRISQYNVATQGRDVDRFRAGDGIGCRTNTSATLTPVTVEVVCTVMVEM